MQNTKSLAEYLDLVKQRKKLILLTWLIVSVASVTIAYNMPKLYRSTATLLIEVPITTKIFESTQSQYAEELIQSIYQKVMTTNNVLSLIDLNSLYSDNKQDLTKFELANKFKQNTEVKLAVSSLTPKTNSGMAEIAFDLSFSDSKASNAQAIASQLANLFIEQNDKARKQRAIKATDFLMEEADKLNRELQEVDSRIAQFKEQNNFSLPEQMLGNQAAIDRTENELRDTDNQIRATQDRIAFLTAELARAHEEPPLTVSPDSKAPRSREAALSSLRTQYLQYSNVYFPSHPTMVRLKNQITALDPGFDEGQDEKDLYKKLAETRRELNALEETSEGKLLDRAKLKNRIEELEQQLKNMRQGQDAASSLVTNPAFLGVEAQYKSSQSELESLKQKQDYLKAKLEKMQNILLQAPQVEMAYTDLIRERDNAIKKYTQLKEKWLDAKLVQTLEEQQQGQTLVLIEQPTIPSRPEKAIRKKVAIGGIFVGLIAGLGLALFVEYLQPGIRGYQAISEVTGLMPLVVIPYIESPSELEERFVKQSQQRKMMVRAGVAFILLIAVLICNFYLQLAPA